MALSGKQYDPLQAMYGNISDQSVAVATTNGATPVTVIFGVTNTGALNTSDNTAPTGQILAVDVIAMDATAGNITLTNNGATVATIAKGTTAGVVTGAVALANAILANGATLSVVSTGGNATVRIFYTS